MWRDHIVEEVRKIRDRHAAAFNYDLDAIFQDVKRQEKKSRKKFIALSAKQTEPVLKKTKSLHAAKPFKGSGATRNY